MRLSKRKRARAQVQSVASPPAVGAAYGSGGYIVGGSSYFGAQQSDARQVMVLPHKDERLKIRAPERTILALKSRVFVENYGPGAAIRNLAAMIGSLKIQSISGDEKWSQIAEDWFNKITGTGLTFDGGGRLNLAMWQTLTTERDLIDGDAFTIFTNSLTSGRPRMMGSEGLCVESGQGCTGPNWIDGVECNPVTRFPLRYCFIQRDAKNTPQSRIVPAWAVHHHVEPRSFSAVRGVPALAHCLNNFQDIIETTSFQKQALKVAALIGLTPEDDTSMGPATQMGVVSPLQRETVFLPPTTSSTATQPPTRVTYEQAMEAGIVATRRMKAIHDDRPHPNGEEFKKTLLREAAIGLRFPPQLLYFMDDPSGAYARIILDIAAKTISDYHAARLAPFMRRTWAYWIANAMRNGDIPEPSKGDWMKIKLTPPRMPTADLGKMGRLYIELRKTCLQSHRGIYEELGMDYEDEIDQCGREFRLLMDTEKKHGLPPGALTNGLLPIGQKTTELEAEPDAGAEERQTIP